VLTGLSGKRRAAHQRGEVARKVHYASGKVSGRRESAANKAQRLRLSFSRLVSHTCPEKLKRRYITPDVLLEMADGRWRPIVWTAN
jgi:predicted nucleic acid-binding Zn ribbon protein